MKNKMILGLLISGVLAGCSSAPTAPSSKMKALNTYVQLEDCASIKNELTNVSNWEKYFENESKYHKSNSRFNTALSGLGAVLSVASSYYGLGNEAQEAASLSQNTATDSAGSQENAQAAAKEQAYIAERRRTLEQMSAVYNCK